MKAQARRAHGRFRSGRPHKTESRSWMPIGLLLAGAILLAAGVYAYVSGTRAGTAAAGYAPEDVSASRPIRAVHEMGEGPAIPFLPRNQPQPAVALPESFYDFGSIGPQDVVERTFVIRNTGDAPLSISRAYTTCGCTTAELSASIIPPGKVATIRLVFDAGFHDAAGQTVRRGLIIENNDPTHSQAEIWIQAAVRAN